MGHARYGHQAIRLVDVARSAFQALSSFFSLCSFFLLPSLSTSRGAVSFALRWKSVLVLRSRAVKRLSLTFCFWFLELLALKPIGCYMVKPHGQLVWVSYTHYCASTPHLSTSSSPTALQGTCSPSEISSWEGLPA